MKGFLTFTLAAGVAITTTSVAHAASSSKGAMNVTKAPATAQAPMGIGALGITFDRTTLTRELDRLNQMLVPTDGSDDVVLEDDNAQVHHKVGGNWNW
jgi:hypothetical protein